MKIGFMRGEETSRAYKSQRKYLDALGIEKVFHEHGKGNIELGKLNEYIRSGDKVYIYQLSNIGSSLKAVMFFLSNIKSAGARVVIKEISFDSSTVMGTYSLSLIESIIDSCSKDGLINREEMLNKRGRIPREIENLKEYVDLVEQGKITVKEACAELEIGKSTYYRRQKELEEMTGDNISETI